MEGLWLVLYDEPDLVRLGVAELLAEQQSVRLSESQRTSDMVLVDPFPPGSDSPAKAFARIHRAGALAPRVTAYSFDISDRRRLISLRAGCVGVANKMWSGPRLGDYLLKVAQKPETHEVRVELEKRTREVVQLVAHGFKNAEIAAEISVSEETVKSEIEGVMKLAGLRNRAHISAWAAAHGLVIAGTDL